MQYYLGILLAMCSLTVHRVVLHSNDTSTPVIHVDVLIDHFGRPHSRSIGHTKKTFETAFAEIQTRSGVLTGYRIKMHVRNFTTNLDRNLVGQAAVEMVNLLQSGEPKVAVLGPSEDRNLIQTATIAPIFHTIQLSYMPISADPTDTIVFPTLYKVNQASDLINHLRIKLMKHFGWKRVATIVNQYTFNVKHIDNFHFLLRKNNMTLVTASVVVDKTIIPNIITAIKNFDVRIIFGSLGYYEASDILCEAFKQGLYGQRYMWILTGLLDDLELRGTNDCTLEEVQIAAHGHFALPFNMLQISSSPEPTITGRTSEEEVANLKTKLFNSTFEMSRNGPVMLDTAWALALGLNNSIKYLNEQGESLGNYSYSEQNLAAIMKGMDDVAFLGVTGPVSFDKSHTRIGITNVTQHFRHRQGI